MVFAQKRPPKRPGVQGKSKHRRARSVRSDFAVARWERGAYRELIGGTDTYHEAEVEAARLHKVVNEGESRPIAMFVPVDRNLFVERYGDLDAD